MEIVITAVGRDNVGLADPIIHDVTTQSNDIAGDLKQFHETVAPVDRDYAISISEIEGIETQGAPMSKLLSIVR